MKKSLLIAIAAIATTSAAFSQSGALDVSFDGDGMVSTEFGNYKSAVRSIAVQPDGKIVAVGSTYNNGSYHRFALTRYNADGSLDLSFGDEGKVIGDHEEEKMALTSVAVQPNGSIIGTGIIYNNYNDSQFFLVKFNEDGSFDTNCGEGGMIIMDNKTINAVQMQPDGKIVAAGFKYYTGSNDKDFLVMRFDENGELDPTFADNGVYITSVGTRDYANSLAIQPDGKIVIAGATFNAQHSDFCLIRLLPNGTPDLTFGLGGMVAIDTDERDEITSLCMQNDEKIVVSGWSGQLSNDYSFAIARLMPNGALDTTFGAQGMILGAGGSRAKCIKMQGDGKILVAGAYEGGDGKTAALSRYLSDGTPDVTFGENGLTTTAISSSCQANAVAIQADGKILLGGEAGPTGGSYNPDFALMRYNSGSELAIGENEMTLNSFLVYPNPVQNSFNIDMNLLNSQNLSIDLFDMNGRKIHNFARNMEFGQGSSSNTFMIPDALAKGTYLLNISNDKETKTIRIIK